MNNNARDYLAMKGHPNIPGTAFQEMGKDCVFQSSTVRENF